jgi:hypothetical protein
MKKNNLLDLGLTSINIFDLIPKDENEKNDDEEALDEEYLNFFL